MVSFRPPRFLALAALIWAVWRIVVWRRNGGDPLRELLVAGLFIWSLTVFYFTFFPLRIVLYSWFGTANFVPFASIAQLIRETSAGLASYNIVGNLLLLAPLGILLPLLFEKLQRLWPLTWRVALISTFIEASQLVTKARSVDVDDVILNTAGGVVGFGIYAHLRRMLRTSESGAKLLGRVGIATDREPLRMAAVPVGVTAVATIAIVLSALVSATIGNGLDGILASANTQAPGATLLARTDLGGGYAAVMLDSPQRDDLSLYLFKKVLPGRHIAAESTSLAKSTDSSYSWGITTYNTDAGELPTIYVWGTNRAGATHLVVTSSAFEIDLPLPASQSFVVGFQYEEPNQLAAVVGTFAFRFYDGTDQDVTAKFQGPPN